MQEQTAQVVQWCLFLCLMVNFSKSELTHTPNIQYLGVRYKLQECLAVAPETRLVDIEDHIRSIFLKIGASARKWLSWGSSAR